MARMIGDFTFEHDGRKYTCTVEAQKSTPNDKRWWFAVTGDQQRYAPIEAVPGDTQNSVKSRIIAFYKAHLIAKAQPVLRGQFGQPGRPPAALKKLREENAREMASY